MTKQEKEIQLAEKELERKAKQQQKQKLLKSFQDAQKKNQLRTA